MGERVIDDIDSERVQWKEWEFYFSNWAKNFFEDRKKSEIVVIEWGNNFSNRGNKL